MKEKVNFTIDEALMETIREMAEFENRSVSNMIEVLLRIALEQRKK